MSISSTFYETDKYVIVRACLKIGHAIWENDNNDSEIFRCEFNRRRYVDYERECIRFLQHLENRASNNKLVPYRQRMVSWLGEHTSHCINDSFYHCYKCYRAKYHRKPYRFADKRFVTHKSMRPIQPTSRVGFDMLMDATKPFDTELSSLCNTLVCGLENVVDAVERPRRSLSGLCLRTIDRFDLRERYDKYATHLLQLVDKQ